MIPLQRDRSCNEKRDILQLFSPRQLELHVWVKVGEAKAYMAYI